MREIKYQGWNGKQMLQVVRIHLDSDGTVWWSNDFKQLKIYNAEHNPMRQYTGLKDKNGKEIYEGDIVRADWGQGELMAEIMFEDAAFVLGIRDDCYRDMAGEDNNLHCEVIGNIYEHSYLLDTKTEK